MAGQSEHAAMRKLVAGLKTKSAKIRALAKAGYARADIARFLGVRYQHVRNVVLAAQEQPAEFRTEAPKREYEWVKVGPDGRLVIPINFRRHLGIENGGDVQLRWDGKTLRVLNTDAVVREAQELAAPYLKGTRSLVDELIADRRAEALKE
jgi:bifunctional DNA-binding transcriptional regulator/antitoxin component of YhaV-PrlF toxin-antitoxin module